MSAGAKSLTDVPVPDLVAQCVVAMREAIVPLMLDSDSRWTAYKEGQLDKLLHAHLQQLVDQICAGLKACDNARIQMLLQYGSLADLIFAFAPRDALDSGTYHEDFPAVRAVLDRMLRDAQVDRKKANQLEEWFSQATAGRAFVEKLMIADAFDDLDRGGKKRSKLLRLAIDADNARIAAEEKLAAAEERIRQLEAASSTSTCHI